MVDGLSRSDSYSSAGTMLRLWSCTETHIWTFDPLDPIEVSKRRKSLERFPQKQ